VFPIEYRLIIAVTTVQHPTTWW